MSDLILNDEETSVIYKVIHPDLEPGVINDAMLKQMIVEQGHKGEAGRLAQMKDAIDYTTITCIRLEFQNLLRIDHLWVLPNLRRLSLKFNKIDRIENLHMLTELRELDLSFNCLERIENLEKLVRMEVLSLFGNRIEKLENLDTLSSILILSLGNNRIDDYEGIDRLRFMKEMRSLNLEGNPIAERPAKDGTFRTYIAAFLPTLKYYNYKYILDEERAAGKAQFESELAHLEETQLNEVKERERIAQELADEQRLSSSFVELLNGHQLFDSFFVDDDDGKLLLSTGEDAVNLSNDFRAEVFLLTQQIYRLGLAKHEIRLKEITMFEECVNEAKKCAQQAGANLINDFLIFEADNFAHQRQLIVRLYDDSSAAAVKDETELELSRTRDDFMAMYEQTWITLMESEAQLYESIEEANTTFGHAISEMLNEFIELAQGLFVQMRDAESNFSDAIYELSARFIAEQAAAGNTAAIPAELQECLEDKDAIVNFVAGSRDVHMQMIDQREDRLVTRARNWATDLINTLQTEEIKRNRNKVMEINYFLDKQREKFERWNDEVEKELDNE